MSRLIRNRALFVCAALLTAAAMKADDAVKHLSSAEATHLAVVKPQPAYPPMAKQLHIEGRVEIEVSINEDGSVAGVHPVSGNAVLANAAAEAVKRWKFSPQAGKAQATMDFMFKM